LEQLDFIDSKFRLALLAARRAKQLVAGSKKKIEMNAENPLTIAIEEIYRGKIKFQILDAKQMEKIKEYEQTQFFESEEEMLEEVEDFLFEGRDKNEPNSHEESG